MSSAFYRDTDAEFGSGSTEQNVEETILADMPAGLLSSLAFPPPRAVLSQDLARLGDGADPRGRRGTLARKLQKIYYDVQKCFLKLTTAAAAVRSAFQRLREAIIHVTWPLTRVVRAMAPERAPITRIDLGN